MFFSHMHFGWQLGWRGVWLPRGARDVRRSVRLYYVRAVVALFVRCDFVLRRMTNNHTLPRINVCPSTRRRRAHDARGRFREAHNVHHGDFVLFFDRDGRFAIFRFASMAHFKYGMTLVGPSFLSPRPASFIIDRLCLGPYFFSNQCPPPCARPAIRPKPRSVYRCVPSSKERLWKILQGRRPPHGRSDSE